MAYNISCIYYEDEDVDADADIKSDMDIVVAVAVDIDSAVCSLRFWSEILWSTIPESKCLKGELSDEVSSHRSQIFVFTKKSQ